MQPITLSAPKALTAKAATTAESLPPDIPMTAPFPPVSVTVCLI